MSLVRFEQVVSDAEARMLPTLRKKGDEIFHDGALDLIDVKPGALRAGVEDGGRRYKVKVWWDDQTSGCTCSCGAAPNVVCEHVWATMLEAEEDGRVFDGGAASVTKTVTLADGRQMQILNIGAFAQPPSGQQPAQPKEPRWKSALARFGDAAEDTGGTVDDPYGYTAPADEIWPAGREVCYVIDQRATLAGKGLVVEVSYRDRKQNGDRAKPKGLKVRQATIGAMPDATDRLICAMLTGGESSSYDYDYYYGRQDSAKFRLGAPLAAAVMPAIGRTGRALFRPGAGQSTQAKADPLPAAWGGDEPWTFRVSVARDPAKDEYVVTGALFRGDERRDVTRPTLVVAGGLVVWPPATPDGPVVIDPLDDGGAFGWVTHLRAKSELRVPAEGATDLLRELHRAGGRANRPLVDLPDELRLETVRPPMTPSLVVKAAPAKPAYGYGYDNNANRLPAAVTFDYGDTPLGRVGDADPVQPVVDTPGRRVFLRDAQKEAEAIARLYALGARTAYDYHSRQEQWGVAASKMPKLVAALVKDGWKVEAEGKLYRQPGEFKIEVTSGIDWFELHGKVQFGDQMVSLPKLLAALRRGEHMITLDDGTLGMLPDDWLKKYGALAGMGDDKGDHIEYRKSQVGVLDALLAARPEATWDAAFEQTRQTLRRFEGVSPEEPHADFRGELRPYQKHALGWMRFLREFSFGGCLADDMGLGKTVQVLAMLVDRKAERSQKPEVGSQKKKGKDATPAIDAKSPVSGSAPTLIVVPRSLIFNWTQESTRFAPHLKILDHSHAARTKGTEHLSDYDIVLTTYGTLRNDITYLKDVEFDYAILDEAHAIKNAASESAKAARLLKARHRLALSGTPVQNHLGELWSLFDFLNPGMLGGASVFTKTGTATHALDEDARMILSRAVRPFVLRRTKEQVAKDLPAKLEQTIFCELDKDQRKHYDELKEFYRQNLLARIEKEGIAKAKIQILEALLRLRQAACHPALIDKSRIDEPSAKLDTLMDRLEEIADEGHKALVFSQFTSFLAIVRKRLDKRKVKYEYLDGKTKDRQARVENFQSDPKLKLFLISLKAGGVGLNLTAADYVFLLDPWWNPAVEAQAIDRTHRIGQTRQVFACRLIAKGTVEEKVLELQQSKRALADAIIGEDNSLIGGLKREDLELLLS